jgi:hypothetical protein
MSVWTLTAEGGALGLDREEVLRALSILIDPGQTFELRSLPHGKSRVCHGQDLPAAVEAAWELSDGIGLYFTLNPLKHDQERAATNHDVTARRWLLVDIDTERPDRSSNATDDERASGSLVAGRILDYLLELGWPTPLVVDSGNGWHLLYRVELPNDRLSAQLVKSCLLELAKRFDTGQAKVDKAVHNAARISKLPGTWVRKGEHTDLRPHRLSMICQAPEAIEVVTVEQLHTLGRGTPEPATNGSANPWLLTASSSDLAAYCRSAIERECGRLAMAIQGDRNNVLNRCAFVLGTMGAWPEMLGVNVQSSLLRVADQVGLGHQESIQTIQSGWEAGLKEPRAKPVDPHANGVAAKFTLPPGVSPIIWGSSIKPKKVEWLWPGRIPLGKQTTFAGQTGMGKTFAVCDIAARVTKEMEIPFCGGMCFQKGKVLIISAEDDADDTIMPRFLELGGDPDLIAFLSPEAEEHFSLAALDLLNKSLDAMGDDVRVVAIDPPTSYLGRTDDHKNAELRGLLGPLKRWAAQRRIALIFVTHVNKATAQKVDAMARVIGSVAWVSAVRAAHMFCPDPDNQGKSLFVPLKVNNGPKGKTLSYEIESTSDDMAVLKWIEEVDMTADEAMGNVKRKSRGMCAVEWLAEQFRTRVEWESDELVRAAKEAGISRNALWSPEVNALPIQKKKRINAIGEPCWMWIANTGWPLTETNGTIGTIETLGDKPY